LELFRSIYNAVEVVVIRDYSDRKDFNKCEMQQFLSRSASVERADRREMACAFKQSIVSSPWHLRHLRASDRLCKTSYH